MKIELKWFTTSTNRKKPPKNNIMPEFNDMYECWK